MAARSSVGGLFLVFFYELQILGYEICIPPVLLLHLRLHCPKPETRTFSSICIHSSQDENDFSFLPLFFFFGSHINEIESMRVRCIPRPAQCCVLRSGRRGEGGRDLRNQFASMQVAAKSRKQGQACVSEKRIIGTLISDPQSCQRARTAAPCGGLRPRAMVVPPPFSFTGVEGNWLHVIMYILCLAS